MAKFRVFLSHASADKGRIKPLALALIEEGFALFIDRPAELNFDASFLEDNDISYIEPGRTWDEAGLKPALEASDLVLACFSREFALDRRVWVQEVTFSDVSGNLVACAIDDVDLNDLPSDGMVDFGDIQSQRLELPKRNPIDDVPEEIVSALRTQAGFSIIVETLRKRSRPRTVENNGGENRNHLPNSSELMRVLPLAGRCDPDGPYHQIRKIIARAESRHGVWPMIVCGPEREVIDSFVNGIDTFLIHKKYRSDSLNRLGRNFGMTRLKVIIDGEEAQLREALLFDVAEKLRSELPSDEQPDFDFDALEFVHQKMPGIAGGRRPLVCISNIFEIRHVRNDVAFFATIDAWIATWSEIADGCAGLSVVAILPVHMVGAKPGWQKKLPYPPIERFLSFLRGPCINALFHQRYLDQTPSRTDAPMLETVGVIKPVQIEDIRDWTSDFAGGRTDLTKAIEARYGGQGYGDNGLNMIDLTEAIEDYDRVQRI